jgi:hypothetical protein
MSTRPDEGRRLDVTYCDDIRQEVGHKFSLMGVYAGDMFVSGATPAVLPKLAIFVRALAPIARPFQSLVVHVEMNGAPVISPTEIRAAVDLEPSAPDVHFDDPEWPYTTHAHMLMLPISPFVIEKLPSILKVHAVTDDGEVLAGRSLRLLPAPEST